MMSNIVIYPCSGSSRMRKVLKKRLRKPSASKPTTSPPILPKSKARKVLKKRRRKPTGTHSPTSTPPPSIPVVSTNMMLLSLLHSGKSDLLKYLNLTLVHRNNHPNRPKGQTNTDKTYKNYFLYPHQVQL